MSAPTLFEFAPESSAALSADGVYRYSLRRQWQGGEPVDLWIMLNPSTADATKDDPTIRRCVAFSKSWGSCGLVVVNLYGFRATDPDAMWAARSRGVDIIGPETDAWIRAHAETTAYGRTVCAWGAHGDPERAAHVAALIRDAGRTPCALGVTKSGQPRHPLYLRRDAQPEPWQVPDAA